MSRQNRLFLPLPDGLQNRASGDLKTVFDIFKNPVRLTWFESNKNLHISQLSLVSPTLTMKNDLQASFPVIDIATIEEESLKQGRVPSLFDKLRRQTSTQGSIKRRASQGRRIACPQDLLFLYYFGTSSQNYVHLICHEKESWRKCTGSVFQFAFLRVVAFRSNIR